MQEPKSKDAPCVYPTWNSIMHKDVYIHPDVNCDRNCTKCGWNPDVAERRLVKIRAKLGME